MKFKLNALVAALAALAAVGSHAAVSTVAGGNSSVSFVALDSVGTNADVISLQLDLGFRMADFLQNTANTTDGTTIVWDFKNNTRTVNGAAATTGYSWSPNWDAYFTKAQLIETRWGVLAGDNSTSQGGITDIGWLATGNPTSSQMLAMNNSGQVSNGLNNLNTWHLGAAAKTTQAAAADAGSTGVFGESAYLGTQMNANFNGQLQWSYLIQNDGDNVTTSTFQRIFGNPSGIDGVAAFNPIVYQLSGASTVDSPSTLSEGLFTFDAQAGTLTWAVTAVPEPGTYAMLLAGLAAVGFVARRRRA